MLYKFCPKLLVILYTYSPIQETQDEEKLDTVNIFCHVILHNKIILYSVQYG
jgi:hypothetical protein